MMGDLIKRRRYKVEESVTDSGDVQLSMPSLGLSIVAATRSLASRRLKLKVKKVKDQMVTGAVDVPDSDAHPDFNYMIIDLYGDRVDG